MKIGVVSDTHGLFDPRLAKLLENADAILHGGDVGAQDVLDSFRLIAPVHAVRGNVDGPELDLPLTLKLSFVTLQVQMMHVLPVPQSELEAWAEAASPEGKAPRRSQRLMGAFDRETGVVIFGHSHKPCLAKLGEVLFFNPGSAGPKRFTLPRCCGMLEVFDHGLTAQILPVESYNGVLPDPVRLEYSS